MRKGIFIKINLLFSLSCFLASLLVYADKLPNDVRWVRESKEYETICTQIFNRAKLSIDVQTSLLKVSKTNDKNKQLAVVVDLDETILDNSTYQVERWKMGLGFTQESWSDWVNRKEAVLIIGAKNFLDFVRNKKIQVVFLSNRMAENLKPTKANLKSLGVLNRGDIFLLRQNKSDTKEIRRQEVLNGTGRMEKVGSLNVIAYLGDQIGDFPDNNNGEFDKKYFLFPNPMYGKW